MSVSEQDELLLNAYLDGELAAIEAARFEQRLAKEPDLAAQVDAGRALRDSLRSGVAEDVPSDALRRRIVASIDGTPQHRPKISARSWPSLAASFLVGALLGGGLIFGALNDQGREDVASQVVSAHIRALMAPQSVDVPSSDRHTVKPWFAGKLAFAPKVVDLSAQGFPLVGARIDVIGLEPAASLVYTKGRHLISVMEMPDARGSATPLSQHVEQGYQALSWSDGKVTYWAVSDAATEELKTFVGLFQAAAGS
jgi:anti-sigma factor RsiW